MTDHSDVVARVEEIELKEFIGRVRTLVEKYENALTQSATDSAHLRSVQAELGHRIDNLKSMNPPMDSHAGGVLVGLMEALELVTNGVEHE